LDFDFDCADQVFGASSDFFLIILASCTTVTSNNEKAIAAVPRKIPRIIPTAAAYRGRFVPAAGENSPLTNSGEITATTKANNPPMTEDASAPATI
jgi:hypothetical protein